MGGPPARLDVIRRPRRTTNVKRPNKAKQGKARVKGGVKRSPGRPSKRTPAVVKRILDGLAAGTPLTILCEPPDMPSDDTVRIWADADPALSRDIARAREAGFDRIALEALRIADTPLEGVEIEETGHGSEDAPAFSERKVRRKDMLGHRRLQVETRLKLLAKWDPKRYGERLAQEISGPDGGPIQTEGEGVRLTEKDEETVRRIAAIRDGIQKPSSEPS